MTTSNKKITVLILEDERSLQQAILKKFESSNIGAVTFSSGKAAIEYLKNNIDTLPDLIWLDYYLEDLSGLDFMYEIKKDAHLANIPVIVVSNSASPDKVQKMLSLGAKKYLLKAENKLDDIVKTIYELMGANSTTQV